jgi:hypothetical protein
VTDAINALPEKIDMSDKDAVAAARAAYDALTEDQKKLVSAETLAKLAEAEAQVKAAEEEAERIDIAKCTITAKNRIYTGEYIVPKATVMYGKTKLKEGRDYTLSCRKSKQYQKVLLIVKGKGKFMGTAKAYFRIIPKGTSIAKATGGKEQITLEWKQREGVRGYHIQYSLHENFSKHKGMYFKGDGVLTATIRKLKADRTYYVRLRTYVKRNNRVFYSDWSKPVTVSTNGAKANEAQVLQIAVNVGDEVDLNALASGVEAWESGNEAVATVSEEGLAKALAAGEAVFTGYDANGDEVRIVMQVSDNATLELGDIDLIDFDGGIIEDIAPDDAFTPDEELELTLE